MPNTPPQMALPHMISLAQRRISRPAEPGRSDRRAAIPPTPAAAISGVINSSYVSNANPIAAMMQTSHCTIVKGLRAA